MTSTRADGTPWVASEFDDRLLHFDRGSEQFIDHGATRAVVATVTGLSGPCTYSDMTGSGLSLVTNPPPG